MSRWLISKVTHSSFYEWFSPGFVALLREILDAHLNPGRNQLHRRLEHFRDVLVRNAKLISLCNDTTDIYALNRSLETVKPTVTAEKNRVWD
jgi:hypothetical protein